MQLDQYKNTVYIFFIIIITGGQNFAILTIIFVRTSIGMIHDRC